MFEFLLHAAALALSAVIGGLATVAFPSVELRLRVLWDEIRPNADGEG